MLLRGLVVRHVGVWAVLQLEGGLIPVRDEHRALVPGDGALVEVVPLDSAAHCDALEACATFRVQQEGGVALLSSLCGGQPVAVLLTLPPDWSSVLIRASTPSPELDEGAEPNGSASARSRTPIPRIIP